jgi:CheY-like chemotaxis protein
MSAPAEDRIRVLHVDDDPAMVDLVKVALERTEPDLDVASATGARDGLDRLREDDIECVLSDYDMPGMNGLEFLERVREECPAIPFLLYTGRGSEELAAEAISHGVSDYIQKDSGSGHYLLLSTRIRREVERARTETERQRRLAALDAAPAGVCVLDEEGEVSYANRAFLDQVDRPREAVVGAPWTGVDPSDGAAVRVAEVVPTASEAADADGAGAQVVVSLPLEAGEASPAEPSTASLTRSAADHLDEALGAAADAEQSFHLRQARQCLEDLDAEQ